MTLHRIRVVAFCAVSFVVAIFFVVIDPQSFRAIDADEF